VFVCRRTDVSPATFAETVPPENLARICGILVSFPSNNGDKLEVSHIYSTSGIAMRQPATFAALVDTRNRLMGENRKLKFLLRALTEDKNRRLRRNEEVQNQILNGVEQIQTGMTQILDWITEQNREYAMYSCKYRFVSYF
jgi:hypothetical protein